MGQVSSVESGASVRCTSRAGSVEVRGVVTGAVQPGHVTLPDGYGMRYGNGAGAMEYYPLIKRLTRADHCDPIAKTPFRKNVPVRVDRV